MSLTLTWMRWYVTIVTRFAPLAVISLCIIETVYALASGSIAGQVSFSVHIVIAFTLYTVSTLTIGIRKLL